ncbi:T9SS type A sorting domain-containing protein [Mucilaginibacter sp. dw_454]|uniref:T9SS type A sorting domain-containing protein n=1 Tax=Mucilaginibacter sp. dw_454 TaxID=2720079 RepID=UPI001BD206C3|nr:T9SS type A sorting domain-containing protein [Mucilaginibacter sp. dw_454]
MRRNFTSFYSWMLLIALAISVNCALATPVKPLRDTISYSLIKRKPRKSPLNLSLSVPPVKPNTTSNAHVVLLSDKLLSNVEVFPNPITDQINLKYVVSRNSNVTIKMVDVLGNDVLTLFSQRVEPGEQVLNRQISNKLNRGFYFIRVIAGTESVIKRISLL